MDLQQEIESAASDVIGDMCAGFSDTVHTWIDVVGEPTVAPEVEKQFLDGVIQKVGEWIRSEYYKAKQEEKE